MMNIMFADNDLIVEGLELSIWTLLTHNKNVNIYVATMNISVYENRNNSYHDYRAMTKEQRDWITKIVKYLDSNSNITFIDCEEYYHNLLEGGVNEDTPFTPYTAIRLMADEMLPNIDDLLYLDSDIAIQGNIEDMYYKYLHNNPYEYAISCAYDAFDGKGEDVAGILLMNLGKMRRSGFLKNARKLYKKNLYRFPDQMAIRDTGPGMRLPETYGYMEPLEECKYNPIILHFTNHLTPKIYSKDRPNNVEYFYKRYHQFKYVQDGLNKLKTINMYL